MNSKHLTNALMPSLLLLTLFAPAVLAEGKAACAAYLNEAEVERALGLDVETAEPVEYSEGFTVCSWTKDRPAEGQLGVNLSLFELKAIREGMVSAETVREYFDLQVASTRETSGQEPETFKGCAKRAVLFTEEHLWTMMIEMEDVFVHLSVSPTDVGRAKMDAVAKAVCSRAKR